MITSEREYIDAVQFCIDNDDKLSNWEADFVDKMFNMEFIETTGGQLEKLEEIHASLGG